MYWPTCAAWTDLVSWSAANIRVPDVLAGVVSTGRSGHRCGHDLCAFATSTVACDKNTGAIPSYSSSFSPQTFSTVSIRA